MNEVADRLAKQARLLPEVGLLNNAYSAYIRWQAASRLQSASQNLRKSDLGVLSNGQIHGKRSPAHGQGHRRHTPLLYVLRNNLQLTASNSAAALASAEPVPSCSTERGPSWHASLTVGNRKSPRGRYSRRWPNQGFFRRRRQGRCSIPFSKPGSRANSALRLLPPERYDDRSPQRALRKQSQSHPDLQIKRQLPRRRAHRPILCRCGSYTATWDAALTHTPRPSWGRAIAMATPPPTQQVCGRRAISRSQFVKTGGATRRRRHARRSKLLAAQPVAGRAPPFKKNTLDPRSPKLLIEDSHSAARS